MLCYFNSFLRLAAGRGEIFLAEGFLYGYNRVQYLQLVVIVIMITHTIFFRFYGLLVGQQYVVAGMVMEFVFISILCLFLCQKLLLDFI